MSRKPQCPATCHGGTLAHPDVPYLPTEPGIWDRYDRSWRSKSAISRTSCSRPRLDRASFTKVRDGIPCRLIEPSSTLHRLRPYRSSNRTDRRAIHGPAWPTTLGGDNWSMARRRLSPYRSRASPRRKLPALKFCTTIAIARKRQANHNSLQCDCIARLPRTTRSKNQ
jgi:hypothetical protein